MRARTASLGTWPPQLWPAGMLMGAAAALYGWAMAPRLLSEAEFGPLCSAHASPWALHCPACYAASAMAALGVGMITWGVVGRRA